MDDRTRQAIKNEIATLEADNRRAQYDVRSKEGLRAGYPIDKRLGLENEIKGLKSLISGNEQRIREFKSKL